MGKMMEGFLAENEVDRPIRKVDRLGVEGTELDTRQVTRELELPQTRVGNGRCGDTHRTQLTQHPRIGAAVADRQPRILRKHAKERLHGTEHALVAHGIDRSRLADQGRNSLARGFVEPDFLSEILNRDCHVTNSPVASRRKRRKRRKGCGQLPLFSIPQFHHSAD